jgi:hypothetical protein
MPNLSYYSNVHNTALVILQRKGYRVWTKPNAKGDGKWICAEKDGWDFLAGDPVQLLGIVSIFEFHQPSDCPDYWWKIDDPWLCDSIPDTPPEFVPVFKRSPA